MIETEADENHQLKLVSNSPYEFNLTFLFFAKANKYKAAEISNQKYMRKMSGVFPLT